MSSLQRLTIHDNSNNNGNHPRTHTPSSSTEEDSSEKCSANI